MKTLNLITSAVFRQLFISFKFPIKHQFNCCILYYSKIKFEMHIQQILIKFREINQIYKTIGRIINNINFCTCLDKGVKLCTLPFIVTYLGIHFDR